LLAEHTYQHRARKLLQVLHLNQPSPHRVAVAPRGAS
jgi:hypothetical protein